MSSVSKESEYELASERAAAEAEAIVLDTAETAREFVK